MRRLWPLLLVLLLAACDATAVSTPAVTPSLDITPLPTWTRTVTPTPSAMPTPETTSTPVVCPTPVLVWVTVGVYEVDRDGYPTAGVPGVTLIFSPIYHVGEVDRQIAVTSGWTGVTLAQFPPGEWTLVAESWPPGYTSMILPDGRGYPSNFFASPDDTPHLIYYAMRIAATRTVTPIPATATPLTVACSNYQINCLPACGANQQENPYGRCGTGLVCCVPMATRTATP